MSSLRNGVEVAVQMLLASIAAIVVSVVALKAISTVEWPAFPSSNQLHALTTAGSRRRCDERRHHPDQDGRAGDGGAEQGDEAHGEGDGAGDDAVVGEAGLAPRHRGLQGGHGGETGEERAHGEVAEHGGTDRDEEPQDAEATVGTVDHRHVGVAVERR